MCWTGRKRGKADKACWQKVLEEKVLCSCRRCCMSQRWRNAVCLRRIDLTKLCRTNKCAKEASLAENADPTCSTLSNCFRFLGPFSIVFYSITFFHAFPLYLFFTILFSTQLFSTVLSSTLLFSTVLSSTILSFMGFVFICNAENIFYNAFLISHPWIKWVKRDIM